MVIIPTPTPHPLSLCLCLSLSLCLSVSLSLCLSVSLSLPFSLSLWLFLTYNWTCIFCQGTPTVGNCHDPCAALTITRNWTITVDACYGNCVYAVDRTIKCTTIFNEVSSISCSKHEDWTFAIATLKKGGDLYITGYGTVTRFAPANLSDQIYLFARIQHIFGWTNIYYVTSQYTYRFQRITLHFICSPFAACNYLLT